MPPPLRDVIARHGLDARKSLGQHFLLDENLCAKIARNAGDLTGRHIIEVGPGPGGLTRALLATPAASVTAVEIDPRAVGAITELQADHAGRLHLIQADALSLDLATLTPAPRQIVANLPYNVGSPLLVRWLHQAAQWERLTLMFQQEVAERIAAPPGSPGYGRLSVLAQLTCQAHILMRIPPAAFTPPPAVHSAVIALIPHNQQPTPELLAAVERVTAAAFGQRRKMLRGSLKGLGGETLLKSANIDPSRRAETLSITEFTVLAETCLRRPGALPLDPTGA
jgi:16S rRNA (adenine1518-N6/adenine1519-N6)-dimethyltransferase